MSLFVLLNCNTFICAKGWDYNEIDGWHYLNQDGGFVTDSWAEKDGLKFYLDDTGHLLINKLKTFDNGVSYYFNYFGAMASNCWVKVNADEVENITEPDPEFYWYYCGEDGKVIRGMTGRPRFYHLDGKTYLFNEYGQLLIGWINEDGTVVNSEENNYPYEEALYYSNSEGELVSGWLRGENAIRGEKYVDEAKELWFYFEPGTYKKRGYNKEEDKEINGKKYLFGNKGYLYTDFTGYNLDNTRQEAFYGEKKGDNKYKAQWAYTFPPDNAEYTEKEKSEKHWMYLEKSGNPVKNAMRRINHKYYAFSENGIMQTGIVAFLNGRVLFVADMEETSAEDIVKKGKFTYYKNGQKYYFYDTKYYEYDIPYYCATWDFFDGYGFRYIQFGTLDREINEKRYFENTGRFDEFSGPADGSIKYYYFGDDGAMVNGIERVHFNDKEYIFGGNRGGHYDGLHNGKYYYDGIQLTADKEIGYGIFCVERSCCQGAQKSIYSRIFALNSYNDPTCLPDELIDYYAKPAENESPYKVLDLNGKIVKGKDRAYCDKQGRYWFIEKNGDWLCGLFTTYIKRTNTVWLPLPSKLDKESCPDVLLGNNLQAKIDYLQEYDPTEKMFNIQKLFPNDFRDAYSFIKSGKIMDVKLEENKYNSKEYIMSIKYKGLVFRSMFDVGYTKKNEYIPFGIKDMNGKSASFFTKTNDFAILPDDDDFFVNCCWEARDAIDYGCRFDSDGVRNFDYLDR